MSDGNTAKDFAEFGITPSNMCDHITLFINNDYELLNYNNNNFTIHNIYKLNKGDKISVRNHIIQNIIHNIEFSIHKIN